MLVPHATDPRDDQGGFPVQLKQDAQGASRCLLFIHGFKTAVAMRAAHAAMSVIMNHHPPIDYRLPSWKQLPVYGNLYIVWCSVFLENVVCCLDGVFFIGTISRAVCQLTPHRTRRAMYSN